MSIRDFCKCHYDIELVRKTDLTSALAIPIGILSVLSGGLVVMAKELHLPLGVAECIVLSAIVGSVVAIGFSTFFLIQSLHGFIWAGYTYLYIATPLAIRKYYSELVVFHIGVGHSEPEAKELAEEETLAYVDSEYAKYADHNAKNNDRKSSYLFLANGAMIAAVILAGLAGIAYVFISIATTAPVPKIEVTNLKEAMPVINVHEIQAVTAPPPPPPPRPTPPPGRVVREHQIPPRPHDPPPSR